ncbi:DEAD/DEAH box helicase [Pedobacter cryotolerans]|uniref:DNA 3'-5' helicase II n=1 Tax=Pedobacter cryotolerans TaxID=2571270 RepID=A0A4U1C6S1_9SPHI|nr:ATP-binding domain-containing protein [Pedobacter cryotolerans]TKC00032.1 hypothetical protein FA045_11365 [Pedobacter cryotolerans]
MIERNINETLVKQEPSAKALLTLLTNIDSRLDFDRGAVYHNFPIYPNAEGDNIVTANVIFICPSHGVFVFQCTEYSDRFPYDSNVIGNHLDEIDRLIFAKILKDAPNLQLNRRSLKIEIIPVVYIHNCAEIPNNELDRFEIVINESQLESLITESSSNLTNTELKELKSTIEGSRGIPKIIDRKLRDPKDFKNSYGAILSAIESEIYNFDLEQKRAALFVVDGPQRIRGLAGSGKTIILAMKAAIIHLQFPDAEILYTYYTKSLNDLIKRLITRFYRQFAERDPNWDKIHVMHAWGGRSLEGVYSSACDENNILSVGFTDARLNRPSNPFDYVCEQLIKHTLKKQYDYSLLDEAQDFAKSFYRLCREITKGNKIIWAYDDFQNILHTDLQNEKETFGKDEFGNWHIDFSVGNDDLQDLVLYKCYRNPRSILISAFALGLGIYNKSKNDTIKIIQRLESNEHWESLGFTVNKGDSSDKCYMEISRSIDNSSEIKNKLLGEKEILTVKKLMTFKEELDFIVDAIATDITKELRPEDISVVCMDNRAVKNYFNYIEDKLLQKGIKSFNLLNAPTNNTVFKVKDHVTLSTIFNAKGNEAGSIYIAGIDSVFSAKDDITERNKIFTAMTRSLAWVTLSGVGETVDYCIDELNMLKTNNYQLEFIQPSEIDVITIKQGIDKAQTFLNKIERIADELSSETDLTRDEIVEKLRRNINKK